MRVPLLATAMAAAVLLVPVPSQAWQGPWCAGYAIGDGSWHEDCSMPSFEVCWPQVIAGNRGYCFPNPRWHGQVVEAVPRRKVRHGHRHR